MSGAGDTRVTPLVPSVSVFPVFHVFHVFHVFTRGVRVCLGLVTPGVTPLPSVSVLPVRAASPEPGPRAASQPQ